MRPHPCHVDDIISSIIDQLILIFNAILVNFKFEYVDCWADHHDDTIIPDKNRFPEYDCRTILF